MAISIGFQPLTSLAPVADSGTVRHRAAVAARLLVAGAVPAVIAAQVTAGHGYDSVVDPLSSLYWTREGWWFPVAVAFFGVGAVFAAVALWGRSAVADRCAALLIAAGLGAGIAAVFPADRSGSSWVGEMHRYGSLLVLVAPLLAGVMLAIERRRRGRPDVLLSLSLAVAAGAGTWFLVGFLGASTSVQDLPAETVGLSQRLLAAAVICVVAAMTAERSRPRTR